MSVPDVINRVRKLGRGARASEQAIRINQEGKKALQQVPNALAAIGKDIETIKQVMKPDSIVRTAIEAANGSIMTENPEKVLGAMYKKVLTKIHNYELGAKQQGR